MTRILYVVIAIAGYCSTSHAALPFEQLLYKGRAIPFYGTSQDYTQQQLLDAVKRSNLAEQMAGMTTTALHLKNDIGVGFESCGSVNAFYSKQRRAVVICSEMIETIGKLAIADKDFVGKLPREQFAKVVDGLIWGIYFHELGHALIDTNRISTTGREEDVADQFAVWFALNYIDLSRQPILMPTIWFWREMSKARNLPTMSQDQLRHFLSDEHSLDEQRIYNLACWAYGTNTPAGNGAARYAQLPEQRAQRCAGEYAAVERGMMSHFRKFLKIRPLNSR
ncbi:MULTISPECIES: DUF4344 domain-containing metallopeptidase [Polaromonas]|uniref:DUF4344 domain-containing metallopeptidase n=1 Tax=Polaromonas aquatica TaxID=332657 RepID=A0ABW1TW36_9BURK